MKRIASILTIFFALIALVAAFGPRAEAAGAVYDNAKVLSSADVQKLTAEIRAGRYGKLPATILFGIDTGGIRGSITSSGGLAAGSLPVVILADSFNRIFFSSEGYSISLGARLCDVINRL